MQHFAYVATASITTARGERYAKQLISHWGRHAAAVTEVSGQTVLEFAATERWPATAVGVSVTPQTLVLTSYAQDAAGLQANNDALTGHLRRWAGEAEELAVDWQPAQE